MAVVSRARAGKSKWDGETTFTIIQPPRRVKCTAMASRVIVKRGTLWDSAVELANRLLAATPLSADEGHL